MRKVVIIGATSGIGRCLAEMYAKTAEQVAVLGRREYKLREMMSAYGNKCIGKMCDVTDISTLTDALDELHFQMQYIDLVIVSAGVGELNPDLEYELEMPALKTNVLGWTYVVDWAMHLFMKQGFGHLVSISSVGGLRGNAMAPAYSATKAYQMNYLAGVRIKACKTGKQIHVTDIRPGFVDTAMAKGNGLFWVSSLSKAGKQIYEAIERKRKVVYVTRRWRYVAFLLKLIPATNWF